jgi:glucosamine--fructose-6-phosphate aminotransferase (isomerizing)
MLREIYEQPEALARTLDRYVAHGRWRDPSFDAAAEAFSRHKDVVIAASGSSRHAGMAAEIMLEDAAGLAVDVEYASEYITRSTNTKRDPAVLVISQSGETADTLAALREAKRRGHPTLAITNVESSSMAREAGISVPTSAGVERAIPATKSFTSQLLVLRLLSLVAAEARGVTDPAELERQLAALWELAPAIQAQLERWHAETERIASLYSSSRTLLYLGRGIHYPIAREGALKLKESSYVHAEGYPAGELKHGPNALVSDEVPLVALATVDWQDAESVLRYEKTVTLLADMQVQGAHTIALTNVGDEKIRGISTETIEIEPVNEYLLPIMEIVPLQMFAYFMALQNGVDVDRPRNLVKSVVRE